MENQQLIKNQEQETASKILTSILDGMDAYLYVTDPTTDEILFINDKMRQHFSFKQGGIGETCWKVLQKGMTERCEFCPNFHLAKNPEDTVVWEEQNTVTGRYYRNSDKLIMWPDGRLVHLQHSIDITEAKVIENELIVSRDAAEQASKAKSEFLARMSHEIRTPLNAIIGMTGIGYKTQDIERKNYCLSKIDMASKHLLGVINDILDMSKIEANKFEIVCAPFDFEKMLINTANIINFRVDEKNHNFVVDLAPDIPSRINSDEQRLAQIITNLLSNAVKFTPDNGTIKMQIKKVSEGEKNIRLLFSVSDNGIGISEEQQGKLFSSFEQADGGKSRKFQGTGLGLAICKKIVELMNGEIWIDSKLDEGTTISFIVEVSKCESDHTPIHTDINLSNMHILAVDDSLEVRQYFIELMESLHLKCDVASSGRQALEMIKNNRDNPYNIFFVDWLMPEMDGIELTRHIKENALNDTVVIMISAARWSDISKEALNAGADRFIAKPLFPSALVDCIHECIGVQVEKKTDNDEFVVPDYSDYTFLLAEDIEINREIVITLIEDTGVKIVTAENGQKAYQLVSDNPNKYDMIFMDIHMPIMDGYESTKLIRTIEAASQVPIIAMTANAFREDVERCIATGMNDHISKPIDYIILMEKIKKNLRVPFIKKNKEKRKDIL